MINAAKADTEGRAQIMTHSKVHPKGKNIVEILQSSGGFKSLTGGSALSDLALEPMKGTKAYMPDQEYSGFGSSPRMTLGSDFDTVKLDKVVTGNSHHPKKVAQHKKSDHHKKTASHPPKQYLARAHKPKFPKVDPEFAAKYSNKKKHAEVLAKAHKAHRGQKLMSPNLALFYTSGPGALSLHPQYGFRFDSAREARVALKRGEISSRSLVQFGRKHKEIAMRASLAFYLQPARS